MRKIFLQCMIVFLAFTAKAQDGWPSPEVEQMYHHAQENEAMGNYKDAITTYRQAIVLAPGKFILYKSLAKALYLSGNYSEAEQTLRPVVEKPEAGDECYYLLVASLGAQDKIKDARAIVKKGIKRFPASGMLFYELGNIIIRENDTSEALNTWTNGIREDPAYPGNYYEAARVYMGTEDVMRGLLLGEIYLNIAQDTTGEAAFKKMLFTGYKTMFDNITTGNATTPNPTGSFIDAVKRTYLVLTPVVSDGITTENLTMVRTRFLLDWFAKDAAKYPYSLFTYQDYLIKNGLFDIYNEWLFGKAESVTEYEAWNHFHPGETDIMLGRKRLHNLQPLKTDGYYPEVRMR